MSKLTKNQKLALGKIEAGKAYTLKEAERLGACRGRRLRPCSCQWRRGE